MSANLQKVITEKVQELSDEQQRRVITFLKELTGESAEQPQTTYSFVGIARSGNGSLSENTESILSRDANRCEGWSLR